MRVKLSVPVVYRLVPREQDDNFTEKRKEVEDQGGEGRLFRWNQTRPKVYPTDTSPAQDQIYGQDCPLQHYTREQRPGAR